MDAFLGGAELTVETTTWSPLAMRELVDALASELTEFAFQREKVLEKLDLRGARQARRFVVELRSFMRTALESGRVDESKLCGILDDCHLVLSGQHVEAESAPPVSIISEVRKITRKMPAIVPMYGEDEPTMPGHRRASLVSLVSDEEDDDNEKTAAGLPDEVVSQYLREVCRATG